MKLDKLLYRYFKQIKNFGVDMDIVRSADEVDSISGAVTPGDQIHYSTVGVLTTVSTEHWPGEN